MTALIIVDIQNDFLPGGALAVPDGDQIIPLVNRLQPRFDLVVATQDWHPADHASFSANHAGRMVGETIEWKGLPQVLWPVHCVQATHGAAFPAELETVRFAEVFRKGMDRDLDSYSGFFDNGHHRETGLANYLRGHDVRDVYVCGLATDYCVKYTAIDAAAIEFKAHVIRDAVKPVNLRPHDEQRAFADMVRAGVAIVSSGNLGL